MTDTPLHFEGLVIDRTPGFELQGFSVDDLDADVAIIHGPNASGKSTLARSLYELIWPSQANRHTSLVGQFSLDGETWRVDVDGGQPSYQRAGQPASRPTLPSPEQRDRYYLALDDFLQETTRGQSLAQAIKRESAGGYDLPAAYDELGFDDSPSTRGVKEVSTARSAAQSLREAQNELSELENEQQQLAPLRRSLDEAREAKVRVELLGQAIDYAKARDEFQRNEDAFAEFPDELAFIDGSEYDKVQQLEAKIDARRSDKDEAEARLETAKAELDEADLPEGGLPDGFVTQLKEKQDKLDRLETRIEELNERLDGAIARRERALQDAPFDAHEGAIEELDRVEWPDVASLIEEVQRVRKDRGTLESLKRLFDTDEELPTERSAVERGSQTLERWLAAVPSSSSKATRLAFWTAIVSGVAVVVSSLALGQLVHRAFYLLLVVAGGIAWLVWRLHNTPEHTGPSRGVHKNEFEQFQLEPPDTWSQEAVRRRLMDLFDSLATRRIAHEREQHREALTPDVDDLEDREVVLEDKRDELADDIGIEVELTDLELASFAKGVARWQESHDEVVGIKAEIESLKGDLKNHRSNLEDALDPYGYGSIDGAPEVAQDIAELEERSQTYEQATGAIEQAEREIEQAEQDIDRFEEQRDTVFDQLGLDTDEEEQLRGLCDEWEAYESARKDRDNAKVLLNQEERKLDELPDFEPALKKREVADLEQEKRDAEATAEQYDPLHEQITTIETRINEAKRKDDLEEARSKRDRALDDLEQRLREDYRSMVGDVLVEHVQETTSETSQPDVLNGAREVLATITRGRYRLDVDEQNDGFRAYDTVEERGLSLDELSSGTRLQLLLSVRLAFVQHQEPGVRLPLILDETLANTDDQKAMVLIQSMLELARTGRQVLYLSAQGDEVAKWQRALEETEDIEHSIIDLATVRELDESLDLPELDDLTVVQESPPDPEGHDHESYAEAIGVPPFDPRRGPGQAHLWYLIEEPEPLCDLLELGVERWGQLQTLATRTEQEALVDDPADLERIQRNGAALEEFVSCWQRGRGPPVTRNVLAESGAVSDSFIDEVTELARELDGDAERLIEALRGGKVNYFRKSNVDTLREYLEEEGYLPSVDTLEAEQVRARVTTAYVETGVDRERAIELSKELLGRIGRLNRE